MSAIRSTLPATETTSSRTVVVPVTSAPAAVSQSADQDMMYAWSIGVTGAARTFVERSSETTRETGKETCPPEVYIG